MPPTTRCSVGAASTARSIVRPGRSSCRNAAGSAAARLGDAKLTQGYRLPARFVIHTVGPVWQGGGQSEAELLASCYRRSLAVGAAAGARTIAFPSISTGIYGYPIAAAAQIAVATVTAALKAKPDFDEITFCCFSPEDLAIYRRELSEAGEPQAQ
jgi:O-acetyl-ADP-ribose deacetylase (regulator of RNase III)